MLHMVWFCHYPYLSFPRKFLIALTIGENTLKRSNEYALSCAIPHYFS